MNRAFAVALLASIAAEPAIAADVSQDAIDACIDRIRSIGGPDGQGGTVLSKEFSEANSLVMFRDSGNTIWRCLVSNDGTSAEVSIENAADDGEGAMAGAPAGMAEGFTATERVQFAHGATSASMNDGLTPGSSTRFVLGAKEGQFLEVGIAPEGPGISYQIVNPDGSFLLELVDASLPYRGQLWQSGEHVVEVINHGNENTSYTITFGIE